jgi:hypothetical protein
LRALPLARPQLRRLRGLEKLLDPGRHARKRKSRALTVKRVCS